jgi:hypothetical protein
MKKISATIDKAIMLDQAKGSYLMMTEPDLRRKPSGVLNIDFADKLLY